MTYAEIYTDTVQNTVENLDFSFEGTGYWDNYIKTIMSGAEGEILNLAAEGGSALQDNLGWITNYVSAVVNAMNSADAATAELATDIYNGLRDGLL
jgi:hypothetical protein